MNLIVCASPFQVLLAEKIIELFPTEKFYSIVVLPEKNDKYSYYADRLFSKCSEGGEYVFNKPGRRKISAFFSLIRHRSRYKALPKFEKVFLANVDNIFFQFLLSSINFKELYSFDDGLANIVYSSGLYNDKRISFITRFIYVILGNKYDYHELKTIIKAHYTVYDKKNIIDNRVKLNLIDVESLQGFKGTRKNNSYNNRMSIFLGQPIYEQETLSDEALIQKQLELMKKINSKFKIDYYFPHPREHYIFDGVKYIKTKLIFEDYFIQTLDMDTHYTIYTFFSGASIYWKDLDNVDVIAIQPLDYSSDRLDNYQIMREFGIEVCII